MYSNPLICLLLILSGVCSGQNTCQTLEVRLDSVTVRGKYQGSSRETNIGSRVTQVNAQILEHSQTRSLSELLSDNTLVYIKSLGQGALATSSFRGTSANHTQVNWNGIRINPPMAGNFDFSQIPVFFADQVALYHGSSHLKNGTGALGGSINLSNLPDWEDSTRLKAFAEYGSWNSYTAAASLSFPRPKALYRTRVYHQYSDNDYRYLNKVLKKDPFYERRKEARYGLSGIMQEAYFRASDHTSVSGNLWVQYSKRRLPQPVIVNVTQHERQSNTTLKYFLGAEHRRGKHEYGLKTAYQLDYLDYRKWFDRTVLSDEKSYNTAQSVNLKFDYSYRPSPQISLNGSLVYDHNWIQAANYSKNRVHQNILALQGNILWTPRAWLYIHGQLMGEINDNRFAPTGSVGLSAQLVENLLLLKTSTAYNYHFPNLNDLYWQPGGNPDLKAEKGFSYDATLSCTPSLNGRLYFKIDATYYAMSISNWIMWLPDPNSWYWQSANVLRVLSHGLELLSECNADLGDWKGKIGINYAYASSTNRKKRFAEDNSYKKQLPYIPKHKGNLRLAVDWRTAFFSYQISYTGIRYTTEDQSYQTSAYQVHDAEIGYRFSLGKRGSLTPKIRANNLFNTYYESTEYYPMPLRNIFGSLVFSF